MDKNYFHIREIARFLNGELAGVILEEAFTQEKNKLVMAFSKNEQISHLEFSIAKKSEYIILRDLFSKAKKNVAQLFPELTGMKIKDIGLYNDDRIISFRLGSDAKILFSFVRGRYNCFIEKDGTVINSFKGRNEFLQKRIDEIFPQRLSHTEEKPVKTVKDYAKTKFPEFGSLYLKEVLFISGLLQEDDISGNEKVIDREFAKLRKKFDNPQFLFYHSGDDVKTALTELEHLKGFEKKSFENINQLIDYQNRFEYKEEKTKDILESKIEKLKKEMANIEGNIVNLRSTIEEFKQAEKYRMYGELILANIISIKEGEKELEVTDPVTYEKIKIKLKGDLNPAENASYYFEKYKKQKNAIPEIEAKVKKFEKQKEGLEKEVKELESIEDFKEVKKLEKEIKKEATPDETSRFRKFVLSDKYEVWVGKDSRANDLLTTKYSAPHDLWFHVRGSSGSHTVLKVAGKKDDVGKEVIKKAAAISAYYSKARNSSLVPVAYCQKKFVKKPKGAKAGTVIMQREKIVNVKPGLPEDY